jgi:hypothetical protein
MNVLWVTGAGEEDPEEDVLPRLRLAKANVKRVHFWGWDEEGMPAGELLLPSGAAELEKYIRAHRIGLVVIDSIGHHLDAGPDENRGDTARTVLKALGIVARRTGCCIILIKHPRKGGHGDAKEQVSGALDWINGPRFSLVVGRDPADKQRLLVASLKSNKGDDVPTLAFTIEKVKKVPRLRYCGESPLTAEDLFHGEVEPVRRSQRTLARELLLGALLEGDLPSETIKLLAEKSLISHDTMLRAKKDIGADHYPTGPNHKRVVMWTLNPKKCRTRKGG